MPEMNGPWKNRIFRFILYLIIGFGCAFLYRYLKK